MFNEFTLICVTKHLCNIVCLKTNTLMNSRSNMALHFKFIYNPKKITLLIIQTSPLKYAFTPKYFFFDFVLYDVRCEAWVSFKPQANNFKFGCLFNHENKENTMLFKQLARFWEGQMEVNSE